MDGRSWFVAYHCFDRYVKVTVFRGAALQPPPPVGSKMKDVRYLHVAEGDLDEAQFSDWVRQAADLPGEVM
jgi:hypothetical protein